jgi:replication factor A2
MRKVGLTNRQDKYISVLGSLKVFGGKRHISATHVRLITDPNEIAHHALKAQWVSLSLRGASEGGGAGAGAAAAVSYSLTILGAQLIY